jgi:hypothetical protein
LAGRVYLVSASIERIDVPIQSAWRAEAARS